MIKLISEKRKSSGATYRAKKKTRVDTEVVFILSGPKKNAQDLKSCEGFPREGSSPSPGTIESMSYGNPVFPEKAKIGVL